MLQLAQIIQLGICQLRLSLVTSNQSTLVILSTMPLNQINANIFESVQWASCLLDVYAICRQVRW